jgi:flagellar motor switch protein FliN/FliY
VNISTPISYEVKSEEEFVEKYFTDDMPKVMVAFTLRIADKLESEFFNVMPMELAKGLVKGFLPEEDIVDISSVMSDSSSGAESVESKPAASSGGMMSQEEIEKLLQGGVGEEVAVSQPASVSETVVQPAVSPAEATPQPTMTTGTVSQQPAMAADAIPQQQPMMAAQPMMSPEVSMMQMQMMQQMMQQMQQMQAAQQQMMENKKEVSSEPKMIRAHAPSTPSLKQDTEIAGGQEENMELILGVPLEISVEIGRTKKLVKDILDFTKGSLVVLDKLAGEQVDLFVNGQCIAKGDVVVVEDNFGIRITEIMKVNFTALE